jgi:hypothetical protein
VVLVDARTHSEHIKVIRSDIGPESVEKYRDVENEPNSEKKTKGIPVRHYLSNTAIFLRMKKAFLKHGLYIT